ncbi:flagellar basal-body MS-ring/collar protein FliF [Xanthomonas arboricola]|uniref:Flagellar M-ring protein n=2 Tax=Xanthomonas arboricola pv. pruni TaxID=69929 RepID=A0AAP4KCS0_9XANT|nr:flagellar basal-body MS-ring/collar protein FliF [Xanthomonas arboricola]MDN0272342.1 flagellar basal-body MS-ring/collar protein FliF [Xanthomonas arboricola pv. pruni]MDN0288737.1 flagellar basal-body MS-ring/collar protein FliF [Xanthomonas arboricola pv. pruni]MDN0292871.1 flagellar basal-body MS-ring/collar protein FliF [Xanthomonas arboricola pv. pruni]MDN0297031.1 flagellar basal-body MS-ring/collar protein FliF [Xanthomonas arboricola pv. pruni]MDN0301164.1 flagellar basal-body MS-r
MALAITKENMNQKAEKAGQWFDRVRSLQITRKLTMMAMIAVAVAAGLAVFFWSQKPGYQSLYTGLDDKGNAEAADLLRTAQIPFKIDQDTGAISVPQDRLYDARLKLAGSGLTGKETGGGFELMEKDPGFGVSQFVENARYQHALETELSRTIGTLRPVREARVHLAIPKPSAFTRQRDVASASVVLELRGGQGLERNQVDAIVNLVASSIPDMTPERVTVVDQSGRMLSIADPNSDAAQHAAQFEQVRRQESSYNQRIRELLEPMTGPGRVNPEVSVDMDFSVVEEARELYNGEPAKLRSEQVSDTSTSATGPQGPPGATSNSPGQPPAPAANATAGAPGTPAAANGQAAAPAAPTESSKSATRNYELDRTLQHTRQPAGRIKRVSVAVLLDNVPRPGAKGKMVEQPLTAAELTRIEGLVKQAVGFDAARGDTVSVMNAPFVREAVAGEEGPKWWEDPRVQNGLRLLVGAVVVLALLFGVVRPTLRQLTGVTAIKEKQAKGGNDGTPQSADVRMVDDDDLMPRLEEDTAQLVQDRKNPIALPDAYEERMRLAREAVKADSKRVAQVVKGWVASEA